MVKFSHLQIFYEDPLGMNGRHSLPLAVVIHAVFGTNVSLCPFPLVFTHTNFDLHYVYGVKAYIYGDLFISENILWGSSRAALPLQ